MRYWLSRLSFSFIAVGLVLAWRGWELLEAARPASAPWQTYALWVAAVVCVGIGGWGVGERHRQMSERL